MPKIPQVEDNEPNRDMLARRLERRGYEVVIALDGQAGVAATPAQHPDLVLMDMTLAVLGGWEATRKLKTSAETEKIPVIALTEHALLRST